MDPPGFSEPPVNGVLDPPVKIRAVGPAPYYPGIDIVFVCTGNICRSPMAEALLRARLVEREPSVSVSSAGLLFDGRAAEPGAVKALGRRDLDLTSFSSRTISAERLASASLVLGMEVRHVREVSVLADDLFPRTSTLPRFVALAEAHGPRGDGSFADWVAAVRADDPASSYHRAAPGDEVEDPMGRSARAFRSCADELDALISRLVDLAWPIPAAGIAAGSSATPGGTHADRHRR